MLASAPNWAEIVTAVGSALTGLTLLAAVISILLVREQLAGERTDRHVQWVTEIGRRWDSPELEESRIKRSTYTSAQATELIRLWIAGDPRIREEEVWTLLRVPNFLEDVALTVEVGDLDPHLVWRTLAGPLVLEWEFWRDAANLLREEELANDLQSFGRVAVRPRRPWPGLVLV